MDTPTRLIPVFDHQAGGRLLDVLIRAGLILVLVLLCYQVFSPFVVLMEWALILAVTLYPLQVALAARLGGRNGWAATLIALVGIALIVVPAAILVNSMGDSMQRLITGVQENTLQIPPPNAKVAEWPIVGPKLHAAWEAAHRDLPAMIQSLQPKIGNVAKTAVAVVAGIGADVLKFVAAILIAAIVMAFGAAGHRASKAIFARIFGYERGEALVVLSVATVRAVAQGVIGIAFLQAIAVGLSLLVAGVPLAGVLTAVVLVLGIAQVPALIVTLPAIGYIWWSGDHGTAAAVGYTVLLALTGMIDNVLKPLMLGRGVDVPMPVILLGALGGMATAGILGLFVGATLLALGYEVFMSWVANNPYRKLVQSESSVGVVSAE
jgi:predicted PurR-regulated permease PerM